MIDAFTARLRLDPVREFYSRAPDGRPPAEAADGYLRSAIARLHAVHVLLFDLGQVDRPPTGRVTAGSWVDRLAPPGAPPKIRAVIERYLRLHLDANLDRPQTVRHARDALRRLVNWMTSRIRRGPAWPTCTASMPRSSWAVSAIRQANRPALR